MSVQTISLPRAAEPPSLAPQDSGAAALALIAALFRRAIDLPRLLHENGRPGQPPSRDDLVRAARRNGFRARAVRSDAERLLRTPLPAIGRDRAGLFFVLARHQPGRTLIQRAGEAPTVWDRDELARQWAGDLVLLAPRETAPHGERTRFDLTCFLAAAARFKALFGEVLAVSFVIRLLGLVTPLFFQVVVDKVLVHKPWPVRPCAGSASAWPCATCGPRCRGRSRMSPCTPSAAW